MIKLVVAVGFLAVFALAGYAIAVKIAGNQQTGTNNKKKVKTKKGQEK